MGLVMAVGVSLGVAAAARVIEPVDPDLIPEAREVLEYLLNGRGNRIVTGMQRSGGGQGPFEVVLHASGREPAQRGQDISGFAPQGSERWHGIKRATVDACLFWWREEGGIVNMGYHMKNPMHPEGRAHKGRQPEGVEPPDVGRMVTPGTEEYAAYRRVLGETADYLEELAEAGVPILWRPLREIEGGWFWWTDAETPENTAELWRQTFDYLVGERGIHNLIWVYHAAHVSHAAPKDREGNAAHRRRFYPGDEYVDIISLSAYGGHFSEWTWGRPEAENYANAYEMLQAIAPGKPAAITENFGGLHNPVISQREGPDWVYHFVWTPGDQNWDWIDFTFNHEHFITLDELPVFHGGNVMPNVRIEWPTDGLAIETDEVEMAGFASDRNGNLQSVSVYALRGPWLDVRLGGHPGRLQPGGGAGTGQRGRRDPLERRAPDGQD